MLRIFKNTRGCFTQKHRIFQAPKPNSSVQLLPLRPWAGAKRERARERAREVALVHRELRGLGEPMALRNTYYEWYKSANDICIQYGIQQSINHNNYNMSIKPFQATFAIWDFHQNWVLRIHVMSMQVALGGAAGAPEAGLAKSGETASAKEVARAEQRVENGTLKASMAWKVGGVFFFFFPTTWGVANRLTLLWDLSDIFRVVGPDSSEKWWVNTGMQKEMQSICSLNNVIGPGVLIFKLGLVLNGTRYMELSSISEPSPSTKRSGRSPMKGSCGLQRNRQGLFRAKMNLDALAFGASGKKIPVDFRKQLSGFKTTHL